MTRRLLLGLVLVLALAAPAFADDIGDKKQAVDASISTLQSRLAAKKQQEAGLRNEIEGVTSRIRSLEAQVGDVSLKLSTLEQDLALHNQRLSKLNELFRLQSQRFRLLQQQYKASIKRLNQRLVAIYESEPVTPLAVVLGAGSIEEAIELTNYLTKIGDLDRHVAHEVAVSKREVQLARKHTAAMRKRIQGELRSISLREAQTRETRDALVGAKSSLDSAKQQKLVALSDLTASERAEAEELDGLLRASADLAAQIRAAQANAGRDVTPSSAGLVWPVAGPVNSGFGWRWGRMHEGIDIGAASGTPIHAAASGRVIYCGWEGGYGNLVVLDNGGNLATAYGHQSSIAVACGQYVNQGDTIGYVGSTGHSTGPHLHFEVRVGGSPRDPLGYL